MFATRKNMHRGKLALALALALAVSLACWAFRRRGGATPAAETFASGDVVGAHIERNAEPALVAALQKMMASAQWLACVPAIQLEKIARTQAGTGVAAIKAAGVLDVLKQRKLDAMARIQRMGVSPAFKSDLIQYADYALSAMTDIVQQFTNADGFVNLADVADALVAFRGGYCQLPTNFGTGNSFLPATG